MLQLKTMIKFETILYTFLFIIFGLVWIAGVLAAPGDVCVYRGLNLYNHKVHTKKFTDNECDKLVHRVKGIRYFYRYHTEPKTEISSKITKMMTEYYKNEHQYPEKTVTKPAQ